MIKTNRKKGFSFVEIAVVIAVLAVLVAILAPALISQVELSRMQKDESSMDEVCNAMQLALADSNTFDEAFSYCINNNYLTYSDSSGVYSKTIVDEEFWAPDGAGAAVTITFNPENGKYDISKGIVNDMTYGNGSVAEKRTAEGNLQQCYFSEMGNQLLYSTIKQSIGETVSETSATYKNSSYTIFIRFHTVDGTRKADVYGQFNGTNLSEGCPAAEGSYTDSFDVDSAPISKNPTGGTKKSDFTSSDLSGGGSVSGIISRPSYKPCDHPSYKQYDDTYHKCAVEDCQKQFKHEYPETGLTAKCTVCEYIKGHTCTFDKNNVCTQCGEEKAVNFTITQSNCYQAGITSLEGDIVIPKTFTYNGVKYKVTSIGEEAFRACRSLTSIIIPDSVKTIGDYAFNGCTSLTSITIPDSVTSIGNNTFSVCKSLTSINIPDSVTRMGNYVFYYCSSLKSITIPDSVTSIGNNTFEYCNNLKSITIPDSITRIGAWAFHDCINLTSIDIPESVIRIENSAFYNCSSLTSIIIPEGVISIGNYALQACSNLTNIMIPDSVTTIGKDAFSGCSSLTSITIPDSVTTIGDYAFSNCSNLTSITIPDSVTTIGDYAFSNCSNLTSVSIPDSITSIGNHTFHNCTSLSSITIPDVVTYIGAWAFYNCSSLTSITIPDSVISIGNYALQACSNLTNIMIPGSVTSIGDSALSHCSKLKTISFQGTQTQWNAISKGSNWKYSVPSSCIVHCTDGDIPI